MMLKKIEDLKKDLEDLDKERIKAEGAYERAMEGLKEMGFDSIEEAEDALGKIKNDLHKTNKEAQELVDNIRKKYADFIE